MISPLGLRGGDQCISKTWAPAAFTAGGNRSSGAASKVRTYTPPPTPHPSRRRQNKYIERLEVTSLSCDFMRISLGDFTEDVTQFLQLSAAQLQTILYSRIFGYLKTYYCLKKIVRNITTLTGLHPDVVGGEGLQT